MKAFVLAGVAALALTGCVTSGGLQGGLAIGCRTLTLLDLGFHAAIAGEVVTIPQSIIDKEAVAMAGVAEICADPTAVTDVDSAIRAIGRAIQVVGQALDELEARGVPVDVPPA